MKSREQKQKDLNALTEQLNAAKSAMIVSFTNLTVNKDQEIRNQLREAGAKYQVVKNTLARLAVKGTPYEDASEHFKGVTAIAWTENDAVELSKTVSKFVKENNTIFTFKAGVVDGKVVDLKQVEAIASLPSKEELISKLLFVLNSQAQRLVTVINAVPRDLAVVIKQIGEKAPADTAAPAPAEAAPAEEAKADETPAAEAKEEAAPTEEATAEAPAEAEASAETGEEPAAPEAAPEAESGEDAEAEKEESAAPEAE
ncbi:MAG: 50S ribosomal protein L10 [Pyrinomonadaceae bacterium]